MTDIDSSELATNLLQASGALRRSLRRTVGSPVGDSRVSDAERDLLRLVRREPGLTVGEVATKLHLASNTISTMVGRLQGDDWIERRPDGSDGRLQRLHLSAPASKRVARWRDERTAVLTRVLEMLSTADRQALASAIGPVSRVVAVVDALNDD